MFIRERCELVRVVTDDVDEAFRVFDSQNYRGKPLRRTTCSRRTISARCATRPRAMKAAVVEAWESVAGRGPRPPVLDVPLPDRPLVTRRECPGLHDPPHRDVQGHLRGVVRLTPADRYHLAAQATLPVLSAWGPVASMTAKSGGATSSSTRRCAPAGRSSRW